LQPPTNTVQKSSSAQSSTPQGTNSQHPTQSVQKQASFPSHPNITPALNEILNEEFHGLERRMIQQENDGTSIPLFIFERGYSPSIDIHQAAAEGMNLYWKETTRCTLECSISEKIEASETKDLYNLDYNETGALFYYTSNTPPNSLYSVLNSQLATRQVSDTFKPFLFYLNSALRKLPNFKGTVFRGIDKPLTSISKLYSKGKTIVWVAFSSTSKKKDEIVKFTNEMKNGGTWMSLSIT